MARPPFRPDAFEPKREPERPDDESRDPYEPTSRGGWGREDEPEIALPRRARKESRKKIWPWLVAGGIAAAGGTYAISQLGDSSEAGQAESGSAATQGNEIQRFTGEDAKAIFGEPTPEEIEKHRKAMKAMGIEVDNK